MLFRMCLSKYFDAGSVNGGAQLIAIELNVVMLISGKLLKTWGLIEISGLKKFVKLSEFRYWYM